MIDQLKPQYIGFAHPFTLPIAVGGYDVPTTPLWRRPDWFMVSQEKEEGRALFLQNEIFDAQQQVGASPVKLFDLARSLPRRIEAQYRRHWSFVPGLWNMYFREQVNLGVSLGATSKVSKGQAAEPVEQNAAWQQPNFTNWHRMVTTGTMANVVPSTEI